MLQHFPYTVYEAMTDAGKVELAALPPYETHQTMGRNFQFN